MMVSINCTISHNTLCVNLYFMRIRYFRYGKIKERPQDVFPDWTFFS